MRGNYRSIYSVLLDDPDYQKLSSDARLLFLTMKICRFNNSAGIFLCDDGTIISLANQAGISSQRVSKALDELSEGHWIAIQRPIVWLVNSLKYEPGISLDNKNHRTGIENIVAGLPKLEIVANFCDFYGLARPFEWPSEGLRMPFDSHSIAIENKDTETDTDTDTDTEKDTEAASPQPRADSMAIKIKKLGDYFCKKVPSLPKIKTDKDTGEVTIEAKSARYKAAKNRLNEHPEPEFWTAYFERIEKSDFLTGRDGKWPGCSFDWILNPTNMTKILEGNYDNDRRKQIPTAESERDENGDTVVDRVRKLREAGKKELQGII